VPKVEWRQTARADLLSIIEFISKDNPDAAQRLSDDVEDSVGKLADQPQLYRTGRVPGTREMLVRKSYIVVYAEFGSTITVLRVLHAARQWPPE
jgi:addiction module RelE/StbE family toxin